MDNTMQQQEDGNWEKAIPLPDNYGERISEDVRNNPEALKKIEDKTGWRPYCIKCGEVAYFFGVSVCGACSNKE